jgi:hypothetical protein
MRAASNMKWPTRTPQRAARVHAPSRCPRGSANSNPYNHAVGGEGPQPFGRPHGRPTQFERNSWKNESHNRLGQKAVRGRSHYRNQLSCRQSLSDNPSTRQLADTCKNITAKLPMNVFAWLLVGRRRGTPCFRAGAIKTSHKACLSHAQARTRATRITRFKIHQIWPESALQKPNRCTVEHTLLPAGAVGSIEGANRPIVRIS